MTNSIAFRLAVGSALWITTALVVSGVLLVGMFDAHVERNFDRRLGVLMETLVAVTESEESGISLRRQAGEPRFDQPYSGWYWQITAPDGFVLRSRSLWDQQIATHPGPPVEDIRTYRVAGPEREDLQVIERGIRFREGDGLYRFVIGVDRAELEQQTDPFDRALGWSLGALWAGMLISVALLIVFALSPLRRIRRALGDVRSGRSDRLKGQFPSEVQPLVAELNAHFDQVTQIVERARGYVGNLAHALKTPLSVLANEAARGDDQLSATVRKQTETMRRRVDHYLVRARTAATAGIISARAPIAPVVEDLRRTLLRIHADKDLSITTEVDERLEFRGDRQDLEEVVGNLLDNACKWARSKIALRAEPRPGAVLITVEDDGPGMPPDQRAVALHRGQRLDEAVDGSGLGLAIVEEIAGLYSGSVALGDASLGGLRVELTLPAVDPSTG